MYLDEHLRCFWFVNGYLLLAKFLVRPYLNNVITKEQKIVNLNTVIPTSGRTYCWVFVGMADIAEFGGLRVRRRKMRFYILLCWPLGSSNCEAHGLVLLQT